MDVCKRYTLNFCIFIFHANEKLLNSNIQDSFQLLFGSRAEIIKWKPRTSRKDFDYCRY